MTGAGLRRSKSVRIGYVPSGRTPASKSKACHAPGFPARRGWSASRRNRRQSIASAARSMGLRASHSASVISAAKKSSLGITLAPSTSATRAASTDLPVPLAPSSAIRMGVARSISNRRAAATIARAASVLSWAGLHIEGSLPSEAVSTRGVRPYQAWTSAVGPGTLYAALTPSSSHMGYASTLARAGFATIARHVPARPIVRYTFNSNA